METIKIVLGTIGGIGGCFMCLVSAGISEVYGASLYQPGPDSGKVLGMLCLVVLIGLSLLALGSRGGGS